MKIKKEMEKYLRGEIFDEGKKFDFGICGTNETRVSLLVHKIFKDKKVKIIHLGACDHLELIDKKIENNTWVHGILEKNSNKILGIDINEAAVKHCHEIKVNNIIYSDIMSDTEQIHKELKKIADEKWDYLVAGEVMEHINDPCSFLKKINDDYEDIVSKCIITVPNAFRFENFKYALKGMEGINSDHKHWFTPYTLCKICTEAGLKIEEVYLTDSSFFRYRKIINRFFKKHLFYGNIVVIAKLTKNQEP